MPADHRKPFTAQDVVVARVGDDLSKEDWYEDNRRGRRMCPQHPQQEMIPLGIIDSCPLSHGN